MNLSFLLDDWKKIPQNLRYFFLSGITLILSSWVADHWHTSTVYSFWGWDFKRTFFSLGVSIIIFGFLMLVLKQLFLVYKVAVLRRRYPISELDKSFYLVWFKGQLILFDNNTNQYFHVTPLETAQDLFFEGQGYSDDNRWSVVTQFDVSDPSIRIIKADYSNGGPINTQR